MMLEETFKQRENRVIRVTDHKSEAKNQDFGLMSQKNDAKIKENGRSASRRFGIRCRENLIIPTSDRISAASVPTSIDASCGSRPVKRGLTFKDNHAAPFSFVEPGDLEFGFFGFDEETLKKHNAALDEMYARNRELEKTKLLSTQLIWKEAQKRQQQEVAVALQQLYGKKGDDWANGDKKKVEDIKMDGELVKPNTKDQGKNEELCREKSATLFEDDWEVAEDCILFKRSRSEKEDDIITLKCVIAYIRTKTGQVADDFEVLYGLISMCGVCAGGLEVLKKKLSKLLSKYLMLIERIRLCPRMTWSEYHDSLHRLGTCIWGSRMLDGTFPLLDSKGIGLSQEHATIADMRAAARRRRERRFRISQDPTIGISRIRPASVSTSVDEAFGSRPEVNPNRGLAMREAGKSPDDQAPEAVADVKASRKQQAEEGALNQRPKKIQRVEEFLLLLFDRAKTEEEDDLMLLRYVSAYGRNVTSPTVLGLYEFILANLQKRDGISWFILKLKLTMLERRYLSILEVLDSNGNMEAYNTAYHREFYRLGRQFWGDGIADQNRDGNM